MAETNEVKYFHLDKSKGGTVLKKDAGAWERWDADGGFIGTSYDWDGVPERLTLISYDEAKVLLVF